ncbi:unnamed protein product [Calypogeia fissa]
MGVLHGPPVMRSLLGILVLICCSRAVLVDAVAAWAVTDWADAHATFYGGQDASGTMGGACGYGNLYSVGYGTNTAALSNALFHNGLSCGACFQLECNLEETRWCYPGKSITITATNQCPQGSEGGWCDWPRYHFDLAFPMFATLAQPVGGVIPVRYKRVSCSRQGGVRFRMLGNPWFNYVMVYNVAGGGDIAALAIRGETTNWISMSQNWGQFWSARAYIVGQSLSFRASLGSGQTLEFWNVADKNWWFGKTFESDYNFS